MVIVVAAAYDLAYRRIPNWLTYSATAAGFALALFGWGVASIGSAAVGFGVTFVPMLMLYAGGTIGAGDVKLFAALGALLGFPMAFNALIASILIGGLLGALILLWQGRLWKLVQFAGLKVLASVSRRRPTPELSDMPKDSFPFAIAIALGTGAVMATSLLGTEFTNGLFAM